MSKRRLSSDDDGSRRVGDDDEIIKLKSKVRRLERELKIQCEGRITAEAAYRSECQARRRFEAECRWYNTLKHPSIIALQNMLDLSPFLYPHCLHYVSNDSSRFWKRNSSGDVITITVYFRDLLLCLVDLALFLYSVGITHGLLGDCRSVVFTRNGFAVCNFTSCQEGLGLVGLKADLRGIKNLIDEIVLRTQQQAPPEVANFRNLLEHFSLGDKDIIKNHPLLCSGVSRMVLSISMSSKLRTNGYGLWNQYMSFRRCIDPSWHQLIMNNRITSTTPALLLPKENGQPDRRWGTFGNFIRNKFAHRIDEVPSVSDDELAEYFLEIFPMVFTEFFWFINGRRNGPESLY